jgi:hypothetical protein
MYPLDADPPFPSLLISICILSSGRPAENIAAAVPANTPGLVAYFDFEEWRPSFNTTHTVYQTNSIRLANL